MNLNDLIYTRKSCRKYSCDELSAEQLNEIEDFISNAKVLNDSIDFGYEILKKSELSIKNRWSAPQYLAIYSEKKDNYGENIGFVFQQVCLFMQSRGIGNCWVGIDNPKKKKDDYVISIAFGKSDDISRDIDKFRRKNLGDISDYEDERLLPALYAPSAINSQPWYFKHTDEGFDVYQARHNVLKRKIVGKWNPIDMGIALAHLYVENPNSFEFKVKMEFGDIKGYTYAGSISID